MEHTATTLRTHSCGELRLSDVGKEVKLCGWVQSIRDKKSIFIVLRDRYGLTQVFINVDKDELCKTVCFEPVRGVTYYTQARTFAREWVVTVTGTVVERTGNKNSDMPTGEIEVVPTSLEAISPSLTPPFLIEDKTDGL